MLSRDPWAWCGKQWWNTGVRYAQGQQRWPPWPLPALLSLLFFSLSYIMTDSRLLRPFVLLCFFSISQFHKSWERFRIVWIWVFLSKCGLLPVPHNEHFYSKSGFCSYEVLWITQPSLWFFHNVGLQVNECEESQLPNFCIIDVNWWLCHSE